MLNMQEEGIPHGLGEPFRRLGIADTEAIKRQNLCQCCRQKRCGQHPEMLCQIAEPAQLLHQRGDKGV